ncbi:MAG TPA: hypothetical protein VMJ10_28395 [Kofleriaceae bacterium]|nr:hypothetical protein [Kofleriaceae bacterium]
MKHALWIAALAACTTSSHDEPQPPPCGAPSPTDQLAQTQNQILALAIANGEIYWLDMGGIGKVSTDGAGGAGGTELVQATSDAAFALGGFITTGAGNVYWADGNFPAGSVDRVAASGGASVQIAATDEPIGIAVDDTNIYWSTFGSSANPVGTIVKQPIAGGAPVVLASNLATVGPIAIDDSSVYWSDLFGAVSSVPIAGGAVRTLVPAQFTLPPATILDGSPVGIALADGRLYWTATPLDGKSPSTIRSVAISGGTATTIATLDTQPTGIAVDDTFVYWAEVGPITSGGLGTPPVVNQGSIRRMARDGTAAAQIVSSGATYPVGPVVEDNALYYSTGSAATTLYRVVL